jgi:hypothetical protein
MTVEHQNDDSDSTLDYCDCSHLNWEASGGTLRPFDDGHIPELFVVGNSDDTTITTTKLVDYPTLFERRPPRVRVVPDAMDTTWVDALYETTRSHSRPAWGEYVTMAQVRAYHQETQTQRQPAAGETDATTTTKDLLVRVVARYLELAMKEEEDEPRERLGGGGDTSNHRSLLTAQALDQAHGVAVWSLRSLQGAQVDYHLDYAEQIRYHTNIIVPPLLAGTLQCTKDKLEGGDFQVSLQGIPHYQTHGYKAKKQPIDENTMISIPYRYNQMICHLGNLPHASTRIRAIHGTQERVIVGFNVFCHTAGPWVQRAPEHSDRFRRAVRLQRYLRQTTGSRPTMSLEAVRRHQGLSRLLVLAKRERSKREHRAARERLERDVPTHLPATVGRLVDRFASHMPPEDVRVFLHHAVRQGRFQIVNGGKDTSGDGLVSLHAELAMVHEE